MPVRVADASTQLIESGVRFVVTNQNSSNVPCPSIDGRRYTIRGRLIAPRRPRGAAGTLLVHGAAMGGGIWEFGDVPGYDLASALARRGHTILVIDRLGYLASGQPVGSSTCVGAQADTIHQIVASLRSGTYQPDAGRPRRFSRIALVGHSVGGLVAEIEASSYRDTDALVIASWADWPTSDVLGRVGAHVAPACSTGGERSQSGGPRGYTYAWPTAGAESQDVFHDADPRVIAAFAGRVVRDPCGDLESVPLAAIELHGALRSVTEPVCLLYGDHDGLFPPPAPQLQRTLYAGSSDLTMMLVPDAGHAVMLERHAGLFRNDLAGWLAARRF